MLWCYIKIGQWYVADPEIVGIAQQWTSGTADALVCSVEQAMKLVEQCRRTEGLMDKQMSLEFKGVDSC